MTFVAPFLLVALAALPLLWWLLRATPPSPRLQDFPAVRLLSGLKQNEETPARTPLWLLLLRMAAAGLIVLGVAGPVLERGAGRAVAGSRPLLLVVDDGWASAHDWQRRLLACDGLLADAARAGRQAALLTTAPEDDGSPPAVTAVQPAAALRARVAALQAHPWAVERAASARALATVAAGSADVAYVADGVAAEGDAAFGAALRRVGRVDELRDLVAPARVLLAPAVTSDGLRVRLASAGALRASTVLAIDGRGGALARLRLPAASPGSDGVAVSAGTIELPLEMRNQLSRLVVEGAPTAATTRLLDESDRRRPVGLLSGDSGSETPLIGSLFYVTRGLEPQVELRRGGLDALLSRPLSVLLAADRTLSDPQTHGRVEDWVKGGGMLVRFSGPRVAAMESDDDASVGADAGAADPLLPVELLPGSRALGGAMSWGKPQHLAAFPAASPFVGLRVPAEVTVSRQVLARPSLDLAAHTWAALADGTPVVTERRLGRGRVVLFHVTANADWSNLPLSGLFIEMVERLTRLAAGIASPGDHTLLEPVLTMDANGALGAPTQAAIGLAADGFGTVAASPRHPPGLYGRLAERRSLNLSDAMGPFAAEAMIGRVMSLERHRADLALGPWLLAAAALLLAGDLVASLWVRGLLGRAAVAALAVGAVLVGWPVGGARATQAAGALPMVSPRAALETELAYVVTGHDDVDHVSHDGLAALSDYVNARTAAVLGTPAGVVPGRDDLSFYPLIYWPILPDAAQDPKGAAALDAYMRTGGVVLIDTEGGDATSPGSGAGFAPGAPAALRRVAAGLDVPPLTRLSSGHVLAHSFYLLRDFPGRFDGAPVWVERNGDPSNDGVSTVIVGANSWAAAWAVGSDGQAEFSALPDGEQQRSLAFRFGVNIVMYALTGNYKSDQVHVPALLQRLGQDGGGPSVSAPDDDR